MRSPSRAALVVSGAAAIAFMLTGCGGSPHHAAAQSEGTSMPGMSGMPTAPPTGPTTPVRTNHVTIKNFAFAPATVTVPVGTTVNWTNTDQDPHTVTSTTGVFRSPALSTTNTFHYAFSKPGTYHYLCTIHPFMRGTVVVTP
jgi:plastocyanin